MCTCEWAELKTLAIFILGHNQEYLIYPSFGDMINMLCRLVIGRFIELFVKPTGLLLSFSDMMVILKPLCCWRKRWGGRKTRLFFLQVLGGETWVDHSETGFEPDGCCTLETLENLQELKEMGRTYSLWERTCRIWERHIILASPYRTEEIWRATTSQCWQHWARWIKAQLR